MKISPSGAKVLKAFLSEPEAEQYGFALMKLTGVKSGSLYPILARFQELGWIDSYEEEIDVREEGRPRRRMYRLTGMGRPQASLALDEFYRDVGPVPVWLPRLQGA